MPLVRAVETARLALPDIAARIEPRLAEFFPAPDVKFMDISSLTAAELVALIKASGPTATFETGREFMSRVRKWLEELPASGVVVGFTHYAVIREAVGALLGARAAPAEIAHAGSIFHLRRDGDTISKVAWNDTGHLSQPQWTALPSSALQAGDPWLDGHAVE